MEKLTKLFGLSIKEVIEYLRGLHLVVVLICMFIIPTILSFSRGRPGFLFVVSGIAIFLCGIVIIFVRIDEGYYGKDKKD